MIEVHSLCKSFGPLKAVSHLSFKVGAGEVLGFLGPNGAGKSTTMKILTGHLMPDSGDAFLCGHSILTKTLRAQQCLGYVPENAPLYEDLYVREFLQFIGHMRSLDPKKLPSVLNAIIETCALEKVQFQKIETLSKGYKRRVSLAQALIHDPKILILDEPTDGLDPIQKFEVRGLIRRLSKEKCILVSTHILEEVEAICQRAIIISEGRSLYDGTPQDLKQKSIFGRLDDVFRQMVTKEVVEGVTL